MMARFDVTKVKVGDKVLVRRYKTNKFVIDVIKRITKTTIALEKSTHIFNHDGEVRGYADKSYCSPKYLMPYDEEFYLKWKNEYDKEVARREVINKINAISLEVLTIEKLEKILEVINS